MMFALVVSSCSRYGEMVANSYRSALNQARADLAEVNKQLEDLARKKQQLETVVVCLTPLSTEEPTFDFGTPSLSGERCEPPVARKSPNGTKDMVVAAIKSANRPLTVPEIHRYVESLQPFQTPSRDAIRVLMKRRTETFEAIGDGLYALKQQRSVDQEGGRPAN